jgi:hypothetical protein
MARWKLTEPHYLSVPSERWEHTTTDSRTGKPIRKMFRVPKHLDPRLEDDWNVRINGMDGEIHVCHEGKDDPKYPDRAIVFEGNPTPGMVPLDDEAKEISGKFDWTPTQGIDEESQRHSFYAKLGDTLIDQMTELKVARETVNPGMDKFMETMLAMMAQNQQILGMLANNAAHPLVVASPELHPEQVIDEEEPLPEVEPTVAELHEAALEAYAKEAASQGKAQNRMTSRRI